MKILTIGTFDLGHTGHLRLINFCEILGDLIVGINTDRFVTEYKGEPPIMTQSERAEFFTELGFSVVYNDSPGRQLIEQIWPDIIAIGSDWARKDYLKQIDVTQNWLDEHQISILYVYRPGDISTSDIKRRIRGR